MANTATVRSVIPITFGGCTGGVYPVVVTFDTTGSDLTVVTPDANQFVGIVGIQYAENSAHNLTVTFGSTVYHTYEMGPYSGLSLPISKKLIHVGAQGEALKLQCSVVISTMTLYVVKFTQWGF